jgi:plastocyanin
MINKIRNIITVTVLAITTSAIMGILVSTYTQQAAIAQYQNFTGSIRISPTLLQTIQSKTRITLTTATTNAEKGVGPNSHAIFARLGVVNGFLVYIINVMDASHSIHRITVDAGNGKVLTSQQIPFGQGGMFGQGSMMGQGGMFGQGSMMGQGGMFGQGSMMGQGGMFGQGSMMGQGGMFGHHGLIFTNPVGNRSGANIQNTNGTLSVHNKVSILPNVPADRSFSPNVINVKIGDIVTWTNYDVIPHTVTAGTGPSDPNKGKEFDSGLSTPLMPGKIFSHRFTRTGGFPYFCQLHPAMAGTVTVP